MTINIEELKRDREAGTPGDWLHETERNDWGAIVKVIRNSSYEFVVSEYGVDDRDARRIARLPDLEAAFLEAVSFLESYASDRVYVREFLEKLK